MAKKLCLTHGTIVKRSNCLQSLSESGVNPKSRIRILRSQLESFTKDPSKEIGIEKMVRSFIESISNQEYANQYYHEPLRYIEMIDSVNESMGDTLASLYSNRVLPYLNDFSNFNEDTIDLYSFNDKQKTILKESIQQYKNADRILNNHQMISKRFHLLEEVQKYRSLGLSSTVEKCCEMLDTYNLPSYQKMNLCLEEILYLLQKESIEYKTSDIVDSITEYFMLRSPHYTDQDIKGFKQVLQENCFLEEDDIKQNILISSPETKNIKSLINTFLANPNKTFDNLYELIDYIKETDTLDLQYNIQNIIWLLWKVYSSQLFKEDGQDHREYCMMMYKDYSIFFKTIIRRFTDHINDPNDHYFISKNAIKIIEKNIQSVINLIIASSDDNYEFVEFVSSYKAWVKELLLDKLHTIEGLVYDQKNIENMNYESGVISNIKDFKFFQYQRFLKEAIQLNQFLQSLPVRFVGKQEYKAPTPIITKAQDIMDYNESTKLENYIGSDHYPDICVAQYYYLENNECELHEFFQNACDRFNQQLRLHQSNHSKAYYIMNPGIIEVHLREGTMIDLTEAEEASVLRFSTPNFNLYIEDMAVSYSCLESIASYIIDDKLRSIKECLFSIQKNSSLSLEHFSLVLEALKFLDVEKEDIELFAEKFTNYRYSVLNESGDKLTYYESSKIRSLTESWNGYQNYNVPLDIQWEAYQALNTILEIGNDEKDSASDKVKFKSKPRGKYDYLNPEHVKELKKNAGKIEANKHNNQKENGIAKKLNSVKLVLQGLKAKLNDFSHKQKEKIRNMDITASHFSKSIKDAMISDRREAIIKGSVIPSFSKCIKIGIGLIGLGVISGNPLVPIITALCGFAVSKRLTQKERILMLDDIEIELKVLEKEISMAESKNQMKKYRELLKIQTDLRRTYQRIRYNIRVGKDILPGSTVGLKQFDDE